MKNHVLSFHALLISVPLLVANALAAERGQLSSSDYEFARDAATAGQFEVTAGRLAADKAMLPGVKQFGEQMVSDHSKAGEKLKAVVTSKGGTMPTELTSTQRREIDRLSRLTGADFDKAYTTLMVSDHKKVLKEFQKAAKHADDADLKAFAAETVPVVEHHLSMATSLEEQAKAEAQMSRRPAVKY